MTQVFNVSHAGTHLPLDVASRLASEMGVQPASYDEAFERTSLHWAAWRGDAQIGRVVETLERIGELDNTLIFVTSDNGASGEGGQRPEKGRRRTAQRWVPGAT